MRRHTKIDNNEVPVPLTGRVNLIAFWLSWSGHILGAWFEPDGTISAWQAVSDMGEVGQFDINPCPICGSPEECGNDGEGRPWIHVVPVDLDG